MEISSFTELQLSQRRELYKGEIDIASLNTGRWWSYVCDEQPEENFEHWISRYVIPITIDQRSYKEEIEYLVNIIKKK